MVALHAGTPDGGPDSPPRPVEFREDEVLIPGWEVQCSIADVGDGFRFTRTTRDRPVVDLRTDHLGALERFLVGRSGALWRSAHHLAPVLFASFPEPGERFTVEEGPERGVTLRWSEDGRGASASGIDRDGASFLALALAHPLEDLLAAYRDPRTGPALRLPGGTGTRTHEGRRAPRTWRPWG
ncbi:hypothetical protein [Kineococcus indalonis]|uniref:hypothetical protein n=1 Tax=Kineococcus indalonis TaxID=2696566 RepID=UPI0014127D59|nr:hypothetical protein [Kineococcus indalonis]NAZ88127.1 hypothetical protein [Kineococcus indalonis]